MSESLEYVLLLCIESEFLLRYSEGGPSEHFELKQVVEALGLQPKMDSEKGWFEEDVVSCEGVWLNGSHLGEEGRTEGWNSGRRHVCDPASG